MTDGSSRPGIATKRLDKDEYVRNFADLTPSLTPHEARVEADRCYFCFDAPCVTACPTAIDIPLFIRQISTGNPLGAARTILDQNILGGTCGRVCPTETLCEEVCVRESAEGKPVQIGRLQRFATDALMASGTQPFTRAAATGRRVAVVGAGPAGLACAHRLAVLGHEVTILEARPKAGGLNEYGIAAYKIVDRFAAREVELVLSVGGIAIETEKRLGRDVTLAKLTADFDAVFLGLGLAGVNALGLEGEEPAGVIDAVAFIAELRQASDLSQVPVGRRVVVVGGGMTAIDAAVQARLLGAREVTIVYRRGQQHMKASRYEQDLAQSKGVVIRRWARPVGLVADAGALTGVVCEHTAERSGKLAGAGERFTLEADMLLKAIGQTFVADPLSGLVAFEGGRIRVDAERRTSHERIWAGGDCTLGGEDLTVTAVADGRRAAESIHRSLMGRGS